MKFEVRTRKYSGILDLRRRGELAQAFAVHIKVLEPGDHGDRGDDQHTGVDDLIIGNDGNEVVALFTHGHRRPRLESNEKQDQTDH